jgi:hypothetical protein
VEKPSDDINSHFFMNKKGLKIPFMQLFICNKINFYSSAVCRDCPAGKRPALSHPGSTTTSSEGSAPSSQGWSNSSTWRYQEGHGGLIDQQQHNTT